MIDKAGEIKYSNVFVVKLNQAKKSIVVTPKPASKYVAIKFFAEKESEVTVRLIDNIGKVVLQIKQKLKRGAI